MFYPVQLDKMRNFKYGMRALDVIEKTIGMPINSIDMTKMTMTDTAIFIWAGLQHEDKNLTPDKVIDLIDEYSSLEAISKTMFEALSEAFGAKKSDDTENTSSAGEVALTKNA